MKVLSLKLKEEIFSEVENVTKQIQVSRNAYINQALKFYNKVNKRKLLRQQIEQESKSAQEVSLRVLEEMEQIEDDLIL